MLRSFRSRSATARIGLVLLAGSVLLPTTEASAIPINFYTSLTDWTSALGTGHDLLTTTAAGVQQATEVSALPGSHTNLGSALTFTNAHTGLSRNFQLNTLQSGATFYFNDISRSTYTNALSVGAHDVKENDDWSFSILGGNTIGSFGVDIRDSSRSLSDLENRSENSKNRDQIFMGLRRIVVLFNEKPWEYGPISRVCSRFMSKSDRLLASPVNPSRSSWGRRYWTPSPFPL